MVARLAVLLSAATVASASAAARPTGTAVYALTGGVDDAAISQRNPRTLAQIGPSAALGDWKFFPALSTDGSLLATLALNRRPPSIRFLDVRKMLWRRPVELPLLGFQAVRWVDDRTVLVLGERPDGLRAIAVDAERMRIIRRIRVPGHLAEGEYAETTAAGTALLLRPLAFRRLDSVLVGVIRRSGAVKAVRVSRILAGYGERARRPALVADPLAGRAYVLGGLDKPVAEVDLQTMRVSYHTLRGVQPLPETLGSDRRGTWIGAGRLALVGFDDGRQSTFRLGLSILDTRTWRLRRIDPDADFLVATGDLLLGLRRDGTMAAYGTDGRRRFASTEPAFQIGSVAGNGRFVYAWNVSPDGRATVIDGSTGEVVARPTLMALNLLLSP